MLQLLFNADNILTIAQYAAVVFGGHVGNAACVLTLLHLTHGAYCVEHVIEEMRLNLVLLHSQLRSELFAVDSVKPGYKLLYSVQHAVKAFGKDGDFSALRALVAAHLHISLVYLIGSVGQRRERGTG